MALAYDHRNDLLSALAAAIGILLGRMGYLWVDPLAGAVVALFVLRTGVTIVRESSQDLMDTIPGKALASRITQLVQSISGVEQVEEIHAHRFGPYLVVNVTTEIPSLARSNKHFTRMSICCVASMSTTTLRKPPSTSLSLSLNRMISIDMRPRIAEPIHQRS